MAVALEDGLIVPVIVDADKKSLREIAGITRELGERARTGKLRLEEVSGGTFTITNLGHLRGRRIHADHQYGRDRDSGRRPDCREARYPSGRDRAALDDDA